MRLHDYRYDGKDKLHIDGLSTDAGAYKAMKDELVKRTGENLSRIEALQERLYADGREGLIIVLQAMDAAGKDSIVKHVMSGTNPQGVKVHSFKAPTEDELAHDFLWRIDKALPRRGEMAIFNRSHYEDVLVVRVHNIHKTYHLPERCKDGDFFGRRYKHIRDFEDFLYDSGYRMVKIFLNVSKETQKKRFLERIDEGEKNWKFNSGDLKERALWDDYQKAYEDAINETATKHCPWYVIPADKKWFTRYLVSEVVLEALKEIDPQFPEMPDDEKQALAMCKETLLNENDRP